MFGLVTVSVSVPAIAVTPVPQGGATQAVSADLPPASQFLPERSGYTSWRTLSQVELVRQGKKVLPKFAAPIAALDGKTIRIQGFMLPMEVGDKQQKFILMAAPSHCAFCLPAGPDSMIEVNVKAALKYSTDVVNLSGTLRVLNDDPAGMYYRLVDAVDARMP